MPSVIPQPAGDDTRSRILEVATKVFAERGMEAVSMRELTALAGVNVAAVNYHFGSKDGLAEAVFEELAPRLNGARLAELAEVLRRAEAAGRRPDLADIVRTFIRPYMAERLADGGVLLAQLLLKHRMAPTPMTHRIITRHFDKLALSYIHAFSLACPDVDRDEFCWRYMFMAGAAILSATDRNKVNRVSTLSEGRIDGADPHAAMEALTRFLVGALGLPS